MNCLECQELLQRRLDGERVSAPDLEAHLSGCSACRRRHAAAGLLLSGLKGLPHVEPPGDLADEIVAAVLRDRVQRRIKMRRRVWQTAALAASIFLMAWAGDLWLPNHRPENPPVNDQANANKNENNRPHGTPSQSEPALAQSVDEARDAMLALTGRLAGETKGQAQLFIAAAPTDVAGLAEQVRNLGENSADAGTAGPRRRLAAPGRPGRHPGAADRRRQRPPRRSVSSPMNCRC